MKTATPALIAYLADASENPKDMRVFLVDLFTITLVNGTIFRFCSGDQPVTVGGNLFTVLTSLNPDVPTIERSRVNSSVGLSVDDMIISIASTPIAQVNGYPLLESLVIGDFDGAGVLVERLIMRTFGDTSLGTIVGFKGTIADINDITTTSAKITVRALTELLNIQMPRNLYQPACRHSLFDAGCLLNRNDFKISGAVTGAAAATILAFTSTLTQPGTMPGPVSPVGLSLTAPTGVNLLAATYYVVVTYITANGETGPSPESVLAAPANNLLTVDSPPPITGATGYNVYVGSQPGSYQRQNGDSIPIGTPWTQDVFGLTQGFPPPANSTGYFTQGTVTFTSGVNEGLSRFVVYYQEGGIVVLIDALPVPPDVGDAFDIYPGCDKQMSTCEQKFNNLIHFGGQPFIPQPETAA